MEEQGGLTENDESWSEENECCFNSDCDNDSEADMENNELQFERISFTPLLLSSSLEVKFSSNSDEEYSIKITEESEEKEKWSPIITGNWGQVQKTKIL